MEEKQEVVTETATQEKPLEDTGNMVPLWRLKQETDKLKEKQEEIYNLKASMTLLEQQVHQFSEKEQAFNTKLAQVEEDKALFKLGIQDDEALEVARLFYAKVEGDDKPSLVEWVSKVKATPEEAPLPLKVYFADQPVAQKATPDNRNIVTSKPAAQSPITDVDIKNMSLDEYARYKKAMMARFAAK